MAVNLSAIQLATTTASGLSNLILVNPKNNIGYTAQVTGASKFLFNYEGENTISLESDITDHFVEDNTAIQDQIALKPEMVTVRGYIGELNDIAPEILGVPLSTIPSTLTTLSAYVPALSIAALEAYNQAFQAFQIAQTAISAGVSAWSSIATGAPIQNKQQQAFTQFYGFWKSRTLFTIQTPWCIFKDMSIKSFRAVQDEETRIISDFEVTFKKMRFAQTITIAKPTPADRALSQYSDVTDQGSSKLTPGPGLLDQLGFSGLRTV